MPVYVAFLRAVNIGGRNVVRKEQLQEVFEAMGYQDISIFKQSGNIIFETTLTDKEAIRKAIKNALLDSLGMDIEVFLRSLSYLQELVNNKPFKTVDEKDANLLVTFLPQESKSLTLKTPIIIPKSTAEIIKIGNTEAYSITHGNGEGGKPNPYLEKILQTQATTRNWNIINEIVKIFLK